MSLETGSAALSEPVPERACCAGRGHRRTDVTYRFGEHTAVDHVSLLIRPGETFGLLGPNGAGKTTTIRMLTTLLKPAAGRITRVRHRRHRPADAGPPDDRLRAAAAVRGRQPDRPGERRAVRPAVRRAARGPQAAGRGGAGRDGPDRARAAPGQDVLRRHGAAAGTGPGAGQRAPAAGPGRAHGGPGPDRPGRRLGAHQPAARTRRDDRADDHAPHGRGRPALRPGLADAPRHGAGHRLTRGR